MKIRSQLLTVFLLVFSAVSFSVFVPVVFADTLYDYYNSGDDGEQGFGELNDVAQTFTASDSYELTYVNLLLRKLSNTGTIYVSLTAVDGSGKPTGSSLSTGSIGDILTSTADWYEITMSSYEIVSSTQYALVVSAPDAVSGTSGRWRGDFSSPTYSGGTDVISTDGGSSWLVLSARDLMFEVYGVPLNSAPVNDAAEIVDLDDSDNLYAQLDFYTLTANVSDDDGFADLDSVDVTLQTGGATERITFRFNQTAASFSELSGDTTKWDLIVGSCSNISSGIYLNLTFVFKVEWDATEEADLDIKLLSTDLASNNDSDVFDVNVDVITDLVVSGFACDDDRGDLSQTLVFSGTVYYADDPGSSIASSFYPPDAEFTAVHVYDSGDNDKGSDSSVVDGAFSVSFAASASVELETYNTYLDMADADYPDAEESPSDTFISDRIILTGLSSNDTAIPINEYVELRATAKLEYDDHPLGSGDSLTIDGLALSWDAGDSRFEGSETKSSAQSKTYDSGSGSEASYGVTVLNCDVYSLTVEWYEEGGAADEDFTDPADLALLLMLSFIFVPMLLFTLYALKRRH